MQIRISLLDFFQNLNIISRQIIFIIRIGERTDTPKGSPGNPLTAEEQYQKLQACCPAEIAEKLPDEIKVLDNISDMSGLIQILKTETVQAFDK